MTPSAFLKEGKWKWPAAFGYMLLTTLAIFIKEVTVPQMADGRTLTSAITSVEMRVSRIETVIEKFGTYEAGAAQRSEAIANLKATVDRIERKLDEHMVK